ncbi:putative protein YyaP [Dyadobacter sp. CECT 9275]|uniref:Bacterial bifunctional deaminase-reductase C-terminal domain-containing protein n=1 Tax=Dyadobacter helix TaxID=2822344 RepID=A0A916NAK7_9BACT|nr:dihydrofolate reductase family protein [Dyadobacter sp. CECT 9275]CAG4988494.1 putative protein YyaP [Dyadobacter sp. CECT 9275]
MRRLTVFNFITLNGYYKGPDEDISWNPHGDEEESEYASDSMKEDGILLFGRTTYEMMAGYWPTSMAMENDPMVAEGMNRAEKIVFSQTLEKAEWNNTRVVSGDIIGEIKRLKQQPGKDMTILGSGSIVSQFAEHGLIDEFQIMINPVAIGEGTPLFSGIGNTLNLSLSSVRQFKSGAVLLCYKPV